MPCLGLPPTATITGPVRSTFCLVDGLHLRLYPGGLPRLDTTRLSLNGVSGTEYASPGHAHAHPRYPYLLAALSSHLPTALCPLHLDLRNRHTTVPWASIRAFSGRSSRPAYCTDAFKARAGSSEYWKVEAWMDQNVTVPDKDPSSDGDETGKGEVEWDKVSADVMRGVIWRKPRYLQHFDPVSVTIIIQVPTNLRRRHLRYQSSCL